MKQGEVYTEPCRFHFLAALNVTALHKDQNGGLCCKHGGDR